MSFPRYPAYKDSGVNWLGAIPSHWSIIQSRRVFAQRKDRAAEGSRQLTASQKLGIVYQDEYMASEGQKVVQVIHGADILKQVEPNDFVISMRSFQGGIEWSEIRGSISSAYVMLIPNEQVYPPFFRYLFKSQPYIQALQSTTNLVRDGQALRFDNFAQVDLPVVPNDEQVAIAKLLDRETAKIDALVAEQEQLITLLKEKRQAVISHAVTKGLDPSVPTKDSGVEWLGAVPAHWSMLPLKRISPSQTVGIVVNPSTYVCEDGLPFIYGGDISDGVVHYEGARRISAELSDSQPKTRLSAGDLVTVRVGAPGVTAVVPPECEGGNCASVMLIRRGNFNSEWLCFLMNSRIVRYQVEVVQYGAAQEQFNIAHATEFILPVPPVDEQNAIAEELTSETGRLGELENEAATVIRLLQERRSALITAAVTGQIDVRGLAPAQEQAA